MNVLNLAQYTKLNFFPLCSVFKKFNFKIFEELIFRFQKNKNTKTQKNNSLKEVHTQFILYLKGKKNIYEF